MSLMGGPALLPSGRRGRIPATNAAVPASEVPVHGRRSWDAGSAGILGLGRSGWFLVVPGIAVRGDLDRLGGLRGRLPGVLGGDGAIGLRLLLADHPELVPRSPEEDQLLALLVS